jgi:hypothetical protein
MFSMFSRYSYPGATFCGFCHTSETIQRITTTPLEQLDDESLRALLWEPADHWESSEVYRHYLPRLLQILGPPWLVDALYPLHPFETMLALGFRTWPKNEQDVVIKFLECVGSHLRLETEENRLEWASGLATLKDPQPALPSSATDDVSDA